MATKKVRRCSVCRTPGHTKRNCKKAPARAAKTQKKRTTKPPVIVRIGSEKNRSEHVVNLRPSRSVASERVSAFREAYDTIKPTRDVVNIAGVVRNANQTTKIEQLESEINRLREQLDHVVRSNVVTEQKKERVKLPAPVIHRSFSRKRLRAPRIPRITIPRPNINIVGVFSKAGMQTYVSVFLILLLVISLPFPAFSYYKRVKQDSAVVVEESTNAFLSLQSSTLAALSANLTQAQFDLNNALSSFSQANNIVEQDHHLLTFVASMTPVVGKQVKSRQHVLRAGHHLALGNTYLVKGIQTASESEEIAMTDRFSIIRDHLRSSMPQYRLALEELSAVDKKTLPVEYQQTFDEFKLLFATFIDDMSDLTELVDIIREVMGAEDFRRYLVMFQNNHEIRPTGGFLGSYALVDVQKGKVLNIEVPGGGTYDIQGQLGVYVEPPLPLQIVNGRWEFQDSNWFPDFPASAKKMEWFYQNGRGVTVDGVIAINASVLERFLRVMGPVSSDEYGLLLDSENVLSALQQQVEVDYDKEENQPKAVLADVLDQLLTGMKDIDAGSAIQLLAELHEAAGQREIQVFFHDKKLQNKIKSFGWTGEVKEIAPTQDYLMVVNTNLGGQKSDAKIEQEIEQVVNVQEDGRIINTVTIKRTHTGTEGEEFYGKENTSYIRVYVPKGSELIKADGFMFPPEEAFNVPEDWYNTDPDLIKYEREKGIHAESGTRVTEEFGKTVFGNWSMVGPGETTSVTFTYKLPMVVQMEQENTGNSIAHKWKDLFLAGMQRHGSRYSIFVQKQSGVNTDFGTKIIYPEGWTPVWRSGDDIELNLSGAVFDTKLEEDRVLGVVMERE